MSGDAQQQEQQPETTDELDADFAAGLGNVPTETPAPTPEPTPEATPEPTPAPTEAPKFVQISEDEWNATKASAAKVDEITATLAKVRDNAFGEIGGLKRILSDLQAKTPKGDAVEINDEDFAELKEQYPELAELQMKGLNKVLSRFKGTGDPQIVEKVVSERLRDQQLAQERTKFDELSDVHPTWVRDLWAVAPSEQAGVYVPGKPTAEYEAWKKTMTPQEAAKFESSNSTLYLDRKLQEFYAWKTAQAAQAQKPKPTPNPTRARQIAAAIPPRGEGGPAPRSPGSDEDDAFMAGLRGG